MQLHELQQQIVENNLDKLYMFTGEEVGIMDIYIDKIVETFGTSVLRLDTMVDAYSKLTQKRISPTPRCYIVRDDKEYLKQDKIWDNVINACTNSNDMLIIIYNNLDKRSKFWKTYQKEITIFDKLSPQLLANYVQATINMSTKLAIDLATISDSDYSRLMLEVQKVKLYCDAGYARTYDESYLMLKEQGVIFQPIGDITFKFTDAIATRDYSSTAEYLLQAKAKNEPEIMVLSILYNTFKQILLVQGLGRDQTNPAARTGLTGWQVNMAKQKQGHYTLTELLHNLRTIRFVEKGIKTGQIEAAIALEYLIVNIM